jgi:hypothetical protein
VAGIVSTDAKAFSWSMFSMLRNLKKASVAGQKEHGEAGV